MMPELTIKEIREQFKKETGKDAIIKTIKEGVYLSGYPKKIKMENYNPVYTKWLENFLLINSK